METPATLRNLRLPLRLFNPSCIHQRRSIVTSRPRRPVQCAIHFRPCIDIHKHPLWSSSYNKNHNVILKTFVDTTLKRVLDLEGDPWWQIEPMDSPKATAKLLSGKLGKVKQIVGSTLYDSNDGESALVTNFISDESLAEFANLYKQNELIGGHVIMLGADASSRTAAVEALHAYPGGMQVGGGINLDNALNYIEEGASHVIVTSFVFSNGKMDLMRLNRLLQLIGKHRLVLDLSCRKKDGKYAIVTDRWQKFTDVFLDEPTLLDLANYADQFLVHGVDAEGKRLGIDEELVALLGSYSPIPVTYAGGVTTLADLDRIKEAGRGRVDVTVGSALDIFGGDLPYKDVVAWNEKQALALR